MLPQDILLSAILLTVTFLIGMAYCVRILRKGRARFDRVDRQGGSPLLAKSVMEMGYWAMQPLAKAALGAGISANAISFAALGFGAAAGVSLGMGQFGVAGILSAAGGILDALDGMVARASGNLSQAGKVLDSALDRYVEFFLFAGLLAFYHPSLPTQLLIVAAMLGSFMVSYTTALSEITQVQLPRGSMQRPERMVYLIVGAALTPISIRLLGSDAPIFISLILIAWAANFSAMVRIRLIRRSIEKRERLAIELTLDQVRKARVSRFKTG